MGQPNMLQYRLFPQLMSTVSFAASLNTRFAVHKIHIYSLEEKLTQCQTYLFT